MSEEIPTCEKCESLVKPDIVFFGEALPMKFFMCAEQDFDQCDLLIIMGTSLVVQPFASLVDRYFHILFVSLTACSFICCDSSFLSQPKQSPSKLSTFVDQPRKSWIQ